MKFIELFAGVGGIGHGLVQAGMECVGYVEMDKYAHQAYQILHDPEERMWSAYDIRDVTDDDIRRLGRERGPISLIAAGFPCQTFSVAGKREGFADRTRGTLFFEVARFASVLRPQYLLLENVDGLRSHDNGRTLGIIISTLAEMGYVGGWQVLNSKDFGVPQNRERIFIVASLGSDCARKVFPLGRENGGTFGKLQELTQGLADADRVYDPDGLARTLKAEGGGGGAKTGLYLIDDQGSKPTQFSFEGEGIAHCLDAGYVKGTSPGDVGKGRRTQVIQRQFAGQYGVTEDETGTLQASMFTLTAQDLHGVAVQDVESGLLHGRGFETRKDGISHCLKGAEGGSSKNFLLDKKGYRIRKLTPLECFRLQSWPDEWYVKLKLFRHPELIELVDMTRNDITQQVLAIIEEHGIKEGISDSQLYKMAGNGVTSAVAYEIGLRLRELHESEVTK